ncbi:hypothetical protein [Flavobacterium sp. '19STA2R22 D10 B1']|uniref:hypothetical protein n=1 Tax=Flavobacterium aerium TaxID=3037261 RepID=UPI00278C5D95|nr:hypothetical protein [Flavobacterium sp. '19STA2R22 D10 B1']
MKKIIAIITLFFAFAINANAQENKAVAKAAQENIEQLVKIVPLQDPMKHDIYQLFVYKNSDIINSKLSKERINELSKVIDAKLRATLSQEQMAKLDAKPEVLKKLTH